MSSINNEPKSASDSDLLFASGGSLSLEAFGKALTEFAKGVGEAGGPIFDGLLVNEDIEKTSAYRDQAAHSKAQKNLIESDTSWIKARTAKLNNLSNQYDKSDDLILRVKDKLGDRWPAFVEYVNSEQWKDG